ncbi:transcriptional regulator, ArsR family [Pseudosulfitobacter pseudonitzschiae]|uniref:ArsR family transcriptional regulator n=1 Tax=Pseudosulfitobacter pseudonitzschiae TaxID=1402135 RepID=A0A073J252_9RHOB|nr:metalloregulator ArsR/SmtB family transcription factor [Pseudosulfitobacter pseudonitzschiae]KEJ96678.1 ArsR family transcriptional regulator [Pseudosulfitobacter pseudonitzschiae]QKS07867.1 helix-turn-helix transcriptional regulator [Pseudosulfitobacter pseudonitzschiae]SHF27674.1 transcriptional regulator, ArsR family [Pseudosulfitobacter pseudonitzschiae]
MAKYDSHLDQIFAALADPTRRAIMDRLSRGPATTSELAAPHDMAMPSLLGHLAKLEGAGLITSTKSGRTRTYTRTDAAFMPVQNWLGQQSDLWTRRLDQLEDYARQLAKDRANGT